MEKTRQEQFKQTVDMIHRFENAVRVMAGIGSEPIDCMDRVIMEYHASKTELLNIVARYTKGGKSDG